MSYLTQKTLNNNVSFSGVALHSGLDVKICIKPALKVSQRKRAQHASC